MCTKAKDYRKFVIYMLPRICKLDGEEISQEERDAAEAHFAAAPVQPVVPGLNIPSSAVKYSNNLPPRPASQMSSPRPATVREPSPRRGLESPRIIIGDAPRGPNTGNRPASPYLYVQDSPRQIPALTGETNKHVISALLSLVKDLNLDGTVSPVCSAPIHAVFFDLEAYLKKKRPVARHSVYELLLFGCLPANGPFASLARSMSPRKFQLLQMGGRAAGMLAMA